LAKKTAFVVIAPPLIPIVACHRDELFLSQLDDGWVAESERTARYAIVSGTPQRMAVHFPQ
jgi:hypothetical protein